jgi:Zn-dependent protease with chaperone function
MDFFEHQERARKSSQRLVLLFALAVAGIVASVYFTVMLFVVIKLNGQLWDPRAFSVISVAVLAVVGAGSLYKIAQLNGGGAVVARRLGGRRVDSGSTDPLEQRVLNVVQEMAIASGTAVPDVYVLDSEPGINAFAAGHSAGDAVIGVTRGAMEKLARDELQGVMGHEFSHLLNGDMKLNLRLMGVIHGILLIGIIGQVLMYGGGGGRSRRSKDGGAQIALLGLALFAIGYLGTIFGNLIKAAVSRQREFLADASAVQFTRNPEGISHALAKIGGLAQGSRMASSLASEASHMFFGDGMVHRVSSVMATHPPLPERILRIDPSFDGRFTAVAKDFTAPTDEDEASLGVVALAGAALGASVGGEVGNATSAKAERTVPSGRMSGPSGISRIGRPGPEHLERARVLWQSVPEPLRVATRHADGALALACTLLLAPTGPERERQLALVRSSDPEACVRVSTLLPHVVELDPEARLPLIEVAAAALSTMPLERHEDFARLVRDLVEGDQVVELSEWVLSRLFLRHLRDRIDPRKPPAARYHAIAAFADEATVLLSALAYAGTDEDAAAARAFTVAAEEAGLRGAQVCARDACPPRALESALETFALLIPDEKRRLVSACAASVAADRQVTARESELFRVVGDWLGAPVPLLLPGQLLS